MANLDYTYNELRNVNQATQYVFWYYGLEQVCGQSAMSNNVEEEIYCRLVQRHSEVVCGFYLKEHLALIRLRK